MAAPAYLALVLHAHLPFVRHPEHERFLEEDWFFEALTETYLPLLDVLEGLARDAIRYRLTFSLSPTLLSMLSDPLLQQRYRDYLDQRLHALAGEHGRTRGDPDFHPLVQFYTERYQHLRRRFVDECAMDVSQSFRRLMEAGHIEIITCAATHGYLPLLAVNEESLYAQLAMAVRTHERILGRRPRGIWLPECGYFPGLEAVLAQFGLDYFFVDTHGLLNADPRPKYGVHRPVRTPGGPAVFARDYESSKQVWSTDEGYPGHAAYRDFYRDAGFDVDAPHMQTLRHAGIATFTGLKYHRITGKTDLKEPYHPERARACAADHAAHFAHNRAKQLARLAASFDRSPIVVCPYDAELFGHWWFEGPQWIDFLLRQLACEQSVIETITPREYLDRYDELQTAAPPACSWGAGGFHEVWLNGSNDWIYPHLHDAAACMAGLVKRFPHAEGRQRWALDQAARELLLAQASDWPFMIKTGTGADYASGRLKTHLHRFHRLADMAARERYDESYLQEAAARDSLFPDMDYRIFQRRPYL